MARYRIEVKASAVKELAGTPKRDLRRIVARIRSLADDPRPPGSMKLSGQERYRIRQGRYRILYAIADDLPIVYVVKIAHRREAYE